MKIKQPSRFTLALSSRIVVLFLSLMLLPASCLAKDVWTRVQSKNFTVVGNADERDLRKIAIHLEQFREAISRLMPKIKINDSAQTTIIVFKSDSSYEPFKPKYKGKVKKNVAGYFLASDDGNYITLSSELHTETPFQVIFHEYFHFLVGNNLARAPVWFNEGLADFYSTFETAENDQKVRIGKPITVYLNVLNSSSLLPLKTLLSIDHSSPNYNDSTKAGVFYSESWALVHYLMLANKGARQPQLTQFIDQLRTSNPLEEKFQKAFQTDYKTIESELRGYTGRRAYTYMEYTFTSPLDIAKEMRASTLSEAEVQYYLGDLLLHVNRLDEAETYLQKSLALDANMARSQTSLAILRIQQGRLEEARTLLQKAIANDPQNYLGHFYYAEDLSRGEKYKEAVEHFKQAIALRPDVAGVHSGLGFAYLGLGQKKEALEEFRQALQLDATNESSYYNNRSYAYLRLGRGTLASTAALLALSKGWREESSMYMVLTAHFGYRQSHNDTEATNILKQSQTKVDTTAWPYPVIRYLLREINAQDLLSQATDNDKQTEAHAYLGLDLSLSGNRDEAITHLRWVKENGNKNFYEYPLALSELKRLEGNNEKPTQ